LLEEGLGEQTDGAGCGGGMLAMVGEKNSKFDNSRNHKNRLKVLKDRKEPTWDERGVYDLDLGKRTGKDGGGRGVGRSCLTERG